MKKPLLDLQNIYPEVDYQTLMAQLPPQSHPRRKLKDLQNKGQLVRLKKGFYILSKGLIGKDYSPQIVANLLYGPSYLSLEYALSFYQLIPERIETFTSVTTQKNKSFETPIGPFTYHHLSTALYPLAVTLQKNSFDERTFLIATPEKALMDMFTLKFKNTDAPTIDDIPAALEEDLRINLHEFRKIVNSVTLAGMRPLYKNRRWNKLVLDFLMEKL